MRETVRYTESRHSGGGYVPAALLVAVLAYVTVSIGGSILVPLLLGFALTFMLEPLTARLERAAGLDRLLSC